MKKYLPSLVQSSEFRVQRKKSTNYQLRTNNSFGFTLIELLVVIAIIAILSVVGVTLFTSTQSKARDARRVQDITAMSRAMEVNYKAGTGYTTTVSSAWFADNVVPSNPSPGGAAYTTGTPTTSTFTFCGALENSTGNATANDGTGIGTTSTGGFFCKKNSQ